MSMSFKLVDHNRDNVREFDTRSEAENKRQDMIGLGAAPEDLEIVAPTDTDGDGLEASVENEVGEVVDMTDNSADAANESTVEPVPDSKPDMDTDPVDWLPSHFVDTIQGVPTLNRKGYAVMCERFGVSVTSEPVTLASETSFEFAEFRATAVTEDGTKYSGFGSAHVDRKDGDDKYLLNELAETRAMKRAAAWATGIGMTAAEEIRSK